MKRFALLDRAVSITTFLALHVTIHSLLSLRIVPSRSRPRSVCVWQFICCQEHVVNFDQSHQPASIADHTQTLNIKL